MDEIFKHLEEYNFWDDSLPKIGFLKPPEIGPGVAKKSASPNGTYNCDQ